MFESSRTSEQRPEGWRRPDTWSLFSVIVVWVVLALLLFTVLGWLWGNGGYFSWGRWLTNWRDVNKGATTSLDLVRVSLTTIGGIGGVGYLVIKYRERASAERTEATAELERAEQKLLSAVQQLGSTSPQVRIAGVYSLTDVADTYQGDYRQRVVDILCGYLRTKRGEWVAATDAEDGTDKTYVSNDGAVESTILEVLARHLRKRRDTTNSNSGMIQEAEDDQLWCDCSIDIHGAILTERPNLQNATFNYGTDFSDATFTQEADFQDATFTQDANFQNATFTQDANFQGVTFSRNAYFGDTTFTRDADFQNAIFTQDANFQNATFSRNAYFGDTTFAQNSYFRSATFTQHVDFKSAQFQHANFSKATFSETARFHNSKFNQNADFRYATFKGDAHFQDSTFAHDAQFQYSAFEGGSQFQGSTFVKDAHFLESTFAQHAFFHRSTFNKEAIFHAATFAGEATFHAATFAPGADFDKATFIQGANFRLTTFTQEAEPQVAAFKQHLKFRHATFNFIYRSIDKKIIFPASIPLDRTTRLPYGARWARFDEDGNIMTLVEEHSPDMATEGNESGSEDPTVQ